MPSYFLSVTPEVAGILFEVRGRSRVIDGLDLRKELLDVGVGKHDFLGSEVDEVLCWMNPERTRGFFLYTGGTGDAPMLGSASRRTGLAAAVEVSGPLRPMTGVGGKPWSR